MDGWRRILHSTPVTVHKGVKKVTGITRAISPRRCLSIYYRSNISSAAIRRKPCTTPSFLIGRVLAGRRSARGRKRCHDSHFDLSVVFGRLGVGHLTNRLRPWRGSPAPAQFRQLRPPFLGYIFLLPAFHGTRKRKRGDQTCLVSPCANVAENLGHSGRTLCTTPHCCSARIL